jgi:hypothetical protein
VLLVRLCLARECWLKTADGEKQIMLRQVVPRLPEENPTVAALYTGWAGGRVGSNQARALLHTHYHKREKGLAGAVGDW